MGWNHIPDVDSSATTSDDNLFAGPKLHTPGKVSVNLPTDEWLCKKMAKLNLTLVQGYPSRTSVAGGLLRDKFVRSPKSQGKWYGFHAEPKKDSDHISSLHTGSSRLNSTYLRIARQAGIASSPMSRPISQENLRKWERSARESTVICNQAAGFNRCLLKIQQSMQSQLKAVRVESKGKTPAKVATAVDELQFLLDFNSSVRQAMAKSMEHLTEFVFVNMANATLLRWDSYLSYLKAGVKADTLNALRTAPLQLDTLFPDSTVKRAEEDISGFDKGRPTSVYKSRRYHPYERQEPRSDKRQDRPAWKNLARTQRRKNKGSSNTHPDQPRASSRVNDNQCGSFLPLRLLAGSSPQETMNTLSVVKFNVVHPVPSAPRYSQKNEISPGAAECQSKQNKLKFVKGVSCVIPLSCAQPVINAPNVATNLPVGARLQNFWEIWSDLGAGPKAVQIPKEGYILPFQTRPNLSRKPTVISCYGNPQESPPVRGITSAYGQKRNRTGTQTKLPRVFKPAIFSPKTQQQVEAYSGLKQSEPLP